MLALNILNIPRCLRANDYICACLVSPPVRARSRFDDARTYAMMYAEGVLRVAILHATTQIDLRNSLSMHGDEKQVSKS